MTTTRVLALLLDFWQQSQVETDACADGIGTVPMQKWQPIEYLSKAVGDNTRTYLSMRRSF